MSLTVLRCVVSQHGVTAGGITADGIAGAGGVAMAGGVAVEGSMGDAKQHHGQLYAGWKCGKRHCGGRCCGGQQRGEGEGGNVPYRLANSLRTKDPAW